MRKAILSMLVAVVLCAIPGIASADILGNVCDSGDAANSAACTGKTTDNPLAGTNGLLVNIANIIAVIAGGAAVIILVVSGIKYVTSGGDTAKVKGAKDAMMGAIIGLIIIVLARAIIYFVVNKL